METTETKAKVINRENMLERGKFEANGYTFTVKPVYLGEVDDYFEDMSLSPVPTEGYETLSDKELSKWAIALFSKSANEVENKPKKKFKFKFLSKLFHKNDYNYYNHLPKVQPLIKWIEQKVEYKGKKIKFYDLERKYGLNKAEIERLFIYFHELSNF